MDELYQNELYKDNNTRTSPKGVGFFCLSVSASEFSPQHTKPIGRFAHFIYEDESCLCLCLCTFNMYANMGYKTKEESVEATKNSIEKKMFNQNLPNSKKLLRREKFEKILNHIQEILHEKYDVFNANNYKTEETANSSCVLQNQAICIKRKDQMSCSDEDVKLISLELLKCGLTQWFSTPRKESPQKPNKPHNSPSRW